jgi:hypothetical protein
MVQRKYIPFPKSRQESTTLKKKKKTNLSKENNVEIKE